MRINVNVAIFSNKVDIFVTIVRIGIGISKTISISNTIKIIASKKNRMENGIRALWFGSNPHSKGEDFSRFIVERMAVIQAIKNTKDGRIIAMVVDVISNIIY